MIEVLDWDDFDVCGDHASLTFSSAIDIAGLAVEDDYCEDGLGEEVDGARCVDPKIQKVVCFVVPRCSR